MTKTIKVTCKDCGKIIVVEKKAYNQTQRCAECQDKLDNDGIDYSNWT